MFNAKASPNEYAVLRDAFFEFAARYKLSIFEAEEVADTLKWDLKSQLCSGIYVKGATRNWGSTNPS